ncbi:CPBP family intramembrane glutamic endopeptidase [Bacillus sp. 1P06AnD]|uniref:CPBP family intramembrane glutamic endopeptidase n=1 Tax=Bacillus sp. 1P06AnD TaxID=3132208 RepID=UPI0039A33F58
MQKHAYPPLSKRPYLVITFIELALIIALVGAGTYITISGHTDWQPPFLAFIPITLILLIYLLAKKQWGTYFYGRLNKLTARDSLDYLPLVAILAIILFSVKGIDFSSISYVGYMLLYSLLIGFVEETLFRGIILRLLVPKGKMKAIIVSSLLFAFTHALNAVGGQSAADTVMQIGYAFLIGLVLASLVVKHHALPLMIIFHALHDFFQFTGQTERTQSFVDYIIMAILLAAFLWLLPKGKYKQSAKAA